MKISNILDKDLIIPDIGIDSPDSILKKLTLILKEKKLISDENAILKKLIERENLASTSIGNKTAIPHTKVKELKKPLMVLATSNKGIIYHEKDEEPRGIRTVLLDDSTGIDRVANALGHLRLVDVPIAMHVELFIKR